MSQITPIANRITANNLNERIPQREVQDELGTLIDTINKMIERLQSSFEQIQRFSMNVTHELRTPLTILKGESELALTKTLSREKMQQLSTTHLEETIRLSRIVHDLFTLAKSDAGQLTLEQNETAFVAGDALRLRQVFRNLLINAVQYTDTGGSVRLSSSCADGWVNVQTADTGVGIPEESLDKIFEPFYRIDASRPRPNNASGLGPSIARWLVELHGGSIHVVSTLGQGSTFTVRLPLLPHP